jgi:hypothetical protein
MRGDATAAAAVFADDVRWMIPDLPDVRRLQAAKDFRGATERRTCRSGQSPFHVDVAMRTGRHVENFPKYDEQRGTGRSRIEQT